MCVKFYFIGCHHHRSRLCPNVFHSYDLKKLGDAEHGGPHRPLGVGPEIGLARPLQNEPQQRRPQQGATIVGCGCICLV